MSNKKPYWIRPPLSVLFNVLNLQKLIPWEINLAYLLPTLVKEMREVGHIDFTAAGMALLSSSTIYKMKSELVLELQEINRRAVVKSNPLQIPPLHPPFRFEFVSTTIENIIKSLESTLRTEASVESRVELLPISPAPPTIHELDQFMINIDERVDELYSKICDLSEEDRVVSLSELTMGLRRSDTIRTFILVLFIACQGKIQLWQKDDLDEIFITIS